MKLFPIPSSAARRLLSRTINAALLTLACGVLPFSALSAVRAGEVEPDVFAPAYASAWTHQTHPDIAAFNAWTGKLPAQTSATATARDTAALAEGVRLAQQRRVALLDLMQKDPERALAAGVPADVRAKLPAEVLRHLEKPFSAVGNYSLACALPALHGPTAAGGALLRSISLDGKTYEAHVYGRRLGLTTKQNIFLHGILLDREAVLDENVLRSVAADEAALDARAPKAVLVPTSAGADAASSPSAPLFAEAGGNLYRFVSADHLRRTEAKLRAIEAQRQAETVNAAEPAALLDAAFPPAHPASAFTTGDKNILVIRVDFSDQPGDPKFYSTTITAATVQNVADTQVKPYYVRSSFDLTDLTTTVSSKIYRLPRTAASYATAGDNDGLHNDARALAGADYDVDSYDRVCVLFTFLGNLPGSNIGYGGLAQVGGPHLWVNGEFDFRVVAHELGHTYGLVHGNLWKVTDGNPASLSGTTEEYGDDFDTMGANYANSQAADFNLWYKTLLDWVPETKVKTVTSSGTYRVSRFDGGSDAGTYLALKIVKDNTRNYYVSIRRSFTDNSTMTHGVYVSWGYNARYTQHNVLDMQTPGNSVTDAALPTGMTFTDSDAQISITPVTEGGTAPDQYEDVQISLAAPPAPVISSADSASATVGDAFSYQITATNSPTSFGASGLPGGLVLNSSTGNISGTPTTAGTYNVTLSATNDGGTGTRGLSLTVTALPPVISGNLNPPSRVGVAFAYQITASNSPTSYATVGLPGGLGVSTKTGKISGTPTKAGTYSVKISATNSGGTGTATLTILVKAQPPVITSALNPASRQGVAFGYNITATNSPTSYTATGLPSGLSLNTTTGRISGTPTVHGTFNVVIRAFNTGGSGSATLSLVVKQALPVITSALNPASRQGVAFGYNITATNSPTSYGATGLPAGLSVNTGTGRISGTPTKAGTYTVAIKATNSGGTGSANLSLVVKPPL